MSRSKIIIFLVVILLFGGLFYFKVFNFQNYKPINLILTIPSDSYVTNDTLDILNYGRETGIFKKYNISLSESIISDNIQRKNTNSKSKKSKQNQNKNIKTSTGAISDNKDINDNNVKINIGLLSELFYKIGNKQDMVWLANLSVDKGSFGYTYLDKKNLNDAKNIGILPSNNINSTFIGNVLLNDLGIKSPRNIKIIKFKSIDDSVEKLKNKQIDIMFMKGGNNLKLNGFTKIVPKTDIELYKILYTEKSNIKNKEYFIRALKAINEVYDKVKSDEQGFISFIKKTYKDEILLERKMSSYEDMNSIFKEVDFKPKTGISKESLKIYNSIHTTSLSDNDLKKVIDLELLNF